MSGFSLAVPGQDNANITRRLSTNIHARPPSMQAGKKLDELMSFVNSQWKWLAGDDANTLEAALKLMDSSSIGYAKYRPRFEQLKDELSSTLKYHVNANYQGFNSSIGAYRSTVQSITDSQKNISDSRNELLRAREGLATRRPTLKDLRASSLKYDAMIDILDKIEELKTVPDKLETQISQKLFLSANETLTGALRLAESKELEGISALEPIKSYLLSQQSSLFSILIEELHNHVYLKSPYCDSRWSAYAQENDNVSNVEQMLEDKIKFDLSERSTSFSGSALLDDFLANFDRDQPIVEDPKKNVESDSFEYIRLLIETLANLSRLSPAFDIMHQRLPTELHKIVDKTINEVRSRYPQSVRDMQEAKPTAGFLDNDYMGSDVRLAVLKDLTWTLYSKLIAVLQAHRVIYEVVESISGRRGESDNAFCYDFNSVFRKVQSEIWSLMNSYITDKSHTTAQTRNMHDLMKIPNGGKKQRDKTRELFKFDQVDYYNPEFQEQYNTLQETLEDSVPGLVSNAYSDKDRRITPYAPTDLSSAHRLLIPPNVFNIRVMLDPTVMFLQKSKATFPFRNADSKAADSFIEEFLVKVFLPQLEDSLSLSFHKLMSTSDTMQIDLQWSKLSTKPVIKGVSSFVSLVKKTCRLLNTGYLYREKYADLIISLVNWLLHFFGEQYESMVALHDDGRSERLSAEMIRNENVQKFWEQAIKGEYDENFPSAQLSSKEIAYMMPKRKRTNTAGEEEGLNRADMLEMMNLKTMAIMATSLRWAVVKLNGLKKVGDKDSDDHESNLDTSVKKRWTLVEVNRAVQVDSLERDTESLMLQGASLRKFEKAVGDLEDLANTCVATLRCDLRARILHQIDRSMTEGEYFIEEDTEERDLHIVTLDQELVRADEMMSDYLLQRDKNFLLLGISSFINEALILGTDHLPYINANGFKKMHSNIGALQQTLKAIVSDPKQVDFRRAITFYDNYNPSPEAFVDLVTNKECPLSIEEAKLMLKLIYSEQIHKFELSPNRQDNAAKARQALKQHLDQLSKL